MLFEMARVWKAVSPFIAAEFFPHSPHSTVTLFARFLGWSTSAPKNRLLIGSDQAKPLILKCNHFKNTHFKALNRHFCAPKRYYKALAICAVHNLEGPFAR
jgi:hypothetical protein